MYVVCVFTIFTIFLIFWLNLKLINLDFIRFFYLSIVMKTFIIIISIKLKFDNVACVRACRALALFDAATYFF